MTKPTKHDRLTAIGIQIERLENFLNNTTYAGRYSEGTIKMLQDDLAKLYQRQDRLINPPAPKPRKPRAPQASVQVADAPKATFEPSEAYVNSMRKTGRNRP